MNKLNILWLLPILCWACGGDDKDSNGDISLETGAMCGAGFQACGGDLKGSWKLSDMCFELDIDELLTDDDGENIFENCKDQPTLNLHVEGEMTITFEASGKYQTYVNIQPKGNIEFPLSCVAEVSMGQATCADLKATQAGNACLAPLDEDEPDPEEEEGTYTVKGNKVTTTVAGEDPDTLEFCVKGNKLFVYDASGEGSDPNTLIVLERD